MNAFMRLVAGGILVALLGVCVVALRLGCSPHDVQQEQRRAEELQTKEEAIAQHEDAKRLIVRKWIAQRSTLAETMQQLQTLEREWEQKWLPDLVIVQEIRPIWKEDRHYQMVRCYVEAVLEGQPDKLALALRRLDREYQQFQASGPPPAAAAEKSNQGR